MGNHDPAGPDFYIAVFVGVIIDAQEISDTVDLKHVIPVAGARRGIPE